MIYTMADMKRVKLAISFVDAASIAYFVKFSCYPRQSSSEILFIQLEDLDISVIKKKLLSMGYDSPVITYMKRL